MMSMIAFNLLSASLSASSATVRFHPLGVLSNGLTLPDSIFEMQTHDQARNKPIVLVVSLA